MGKLALYCTRIAGEVPPKCGTHSVNTEQKFFHLTGRRMKEIDLMRVSKVVGYNARCNYLSIVATSARH